MKTMIIAVATMAALCSCSAPREIQVEMVNAELVKIDSVQRYQNDREYLLTWRDKYNIDYVTYTPVYYSLGTRMLVFVRR
jgi:hypothetical protein